ncbi:MAG TPA: hypothetical protein VHL61_11190 [Luteimonas sp.]|jgi:hypothetical protein|nr:hypothetical protein [Luteimonas sp.]
MLRSLFATFAATLVLAALPAPMPVHAASAILRCQSPDGTLVYTDKACGAFGAKAAPMPGALLSRIYHDEARFDADSDADAPAVLPPVERRSASRGCARTPTQLAMDLRGSLALGDVNRVAESYHWVGMSSRQGERTLDHLQRLIGKPVLDSHYFDASIGPGSAMGATLVATNDDGIGGDAGMLQLVLGDDGSRSAIDFDVHRYAGCYFISF